MADKIYLNSRFGYREDTLANWQEADPILERGEIAFVRDGSDGEFVKIGDGSTPWALLPYAPLPKGEKGAQGETGPKGEQGIQGEKGEKGDPGTDGKDAVIDQIFNPESENAQSGVAVAEAIDRKADKEEWEQIADVTLKENAVFNITTDINGKSFAIKKFIAVLSKPAVEGSTTATAIWIKAKTTKNNSFLPIVAVEGNKTYADNIKQVYRYEGEIKYRWETNFRLGQDQTDNTTFAYGEFTAKYGTRAEFKHNHPVTAFQFTWGYSGALPVGTRVEIWGVRA